MNDLQQHSAPYVLVTVETLDALFDEISLLKDMVEDARTPQHTIVEGMVRGIDPNALYAVSFVATRWGYSEDYVRALSRKKLPRADWKGGEIRYRGVSILRYENVPEEELCPENVVPLQPASPTRRKPATQRQGKRPYNNTLPQL